MLGPAPSSANSGRAAETVGGDGCWTISAKACFCHSGTPGARCFRGERAVHQARRWGNRNATSPSRTALNELREGEFGPWPYNGISRSSGGRLGRFSGEVSEGIVAIDEAPRPLGPTREMKSAGCPGPSCLRIKGELSAVGGRTLTAAEGGRKISSGKPLDWARRQGRLVMGAACRHEPRSICGATTIAPTAAA